jgi:hypothetical protein
MEKWSGKWISSQAQMPCESIAVVGVKVGEQEGPDVVHDSNDYGIHITQQTSSHVPRNTIA